MESFIEDYPKTYRSLIKAMIEACQYCSKPENRGEVAKIIAGRSFTGAKPKGCKLPAMIDDTNLNTLPACATAFTGPGIIGCYDYGGFDGKSRRIDSVDTTLFFDLPANLPHPSGDHSTFLWQSQSLWLMTQSTRWGQIKEFPVNAEALARKAWRTDLYREIAAEMGIECPQEDAKIEPAEAFVDKKAFDPSDPVGYLNSFEIRAQSPTRFYQSA